MNDHHEVGRGFSDRHPKAGDVFGQTRLRDRDAVLDEDLRLIDVHPSLEDDVDRNPSVSCRLRGDVEHVVNTVDLLLDGRRHGRRDDFGGGARVAGADIHRRRRDLRIFRDRQGSLRDGAGDGEKDREDGGEDRPVDEEMGKSHPRSLAARWVMVSSKTAADGAVLRSDDGRPAARKDWRGRRSRHDRFDQGPPIRRANLHGFGRAAPASPQFCCPVSP